AKLLDSLLLLFLGVAVESLLLVAHPEKRRVENVQMAGADQLGEKLQEKGQKQQANVHAVHIGIGSYNHPVVAQPVQPVFDLQGMLEQIELFIFIYDLFRQSVTVQGLTPQAEDCLSAHVPGFSDGATCGVTLSDENRRLKPVLLVGFSR